MQLEHSGLKRCMLERKDFEQAIGEADRVLHQAEIMKAVNENLKSWAEAELAKLPPVEKKEE